MFIYGQMYIVPILLFILYDIALWQKYTVTCINKLRSCYNKYTIERRKLRHPNNLT